MLMKHVKHNRKSFLCAQVARIHTFCKETFRFKVLEMRDFVEQRIVHIARFFVYAIPK